jgi:hypothetical protein
MRYLAAVIIAGLAALVMVLPAQEPPTPGDAPGGDAPPVAICPIVELGDRGTSISILSSVNGEGRLSSFSAGESTGAVEFRTGGSGAVTVPAGDAGAVGTAGGLVEMPSDTTAAAAVITGPETRAAESCGDAPTDIAFISGGSTISDAFFEIQLINPYAGEANVDLTVFSENGVETNEAFNSVIVPALSSISLDLTQIIPGREQISVNIEPSRGSVLAYGRQTIGAEVAMWRAVAPGQEWWLPVPPGGATKQMIISSPEAAEIEYQVDLYGPEGFVEAHDSGVIAPRGNVTVPLAAITEGAVGVRVISTGPVVPALRIDSPEGLAWTAASPVTAPVWLLPGASAPPGGAGTLVILNGGIEPVVATIKTLTDTAVSRELEVAAEGVLVTNLVAANGYRVEATGPIVAMWTSRSGTATAAAMGIPLQDG